MFRQPRFPLARLSIGVLLVLLTSGCMPVATHEAVVADLTEQHVAELAAERDDAQQQLAAARDSYEQELAAQRDDFRRQNDALGEQIAWFQQRLEYFEGAPSTGIPLLVGVPAALVATVVLLWLYLRNRLLTRIAAVSFPHNVGVRTINGAPPKSFPKEEVTYDNFAR